MAHAVKPTATAEGFTPAEQLALEAIVARQIAAQRVPGAVVGVWVPGRGVWSHSDGIGDLRTAAPIASDDHFRIASVTKTFTATVVLQLVDEGRLRLDDTLEPFVPGIPNGREITIRQMSGMTAGIYDFTMDEQFVADYARDPLMPFTPDDVLAIVARHKPDFAPGASLRYSDTNYTLLGMIIKQATGQSAAAAITERVITPLGLTETSFPTTSVMPEPFAHGYAAEPNSPDLQDLSMSNPDVAWTAGAMISTLADLRIWAKALADGTLLSAQTQRERLQWVALPGASRVPVSYGLGIMDVAGFIGHNGSIYGYSTWMLSLPETGATIVVLANRGETQTEYAGGIAIGIARFLYPERFPELKGTPTVPGTPAA